MASSSSTTTNKKPRIVVKQTWRKSLIIDLTKEDEVTTPPPFSKPNSPTPPNATIKTPSLRGTSSSSSIPSKPNSSPFYSSSPSTNPYLESSNDTPLRVAHPPTIQNQDYQPMDVTITLSPISPLDYALPTPSSSSSPIPIMGYPVHLNLLDLYGANCMCCLHNRNLIIALRDELHFRLNYIEHLPTPPSAPYSPPINTPPPN
ncbi:hypothetical protein Tco_0748635 [Tanacetum coccineum]|uniref:Uncharacterized protein n=1 Tax=Tanacetum coccineum TaxID=301880 RepID=A0ABQ4YW78_9ASTR